jgi:hypothetical protein
MPAPDPSTCRPTHGKVHHGSICMQKIVSVSDLISDLGDGVLECMEVLDLW